MQMKGIPGKDSPLRFIIVFIVLFLVFYFGNILFFGLTSEGHHYNAFLDRNLNYIRLLRHCLLNTTAALLNWSGFTAITSDTELLVAGRGVIRLVYSCLGLGLMSFFTAFVIAYPKPLKAKLTFGLTGNIAIQLLNILRFYLLALFWNKTRGIILDHHTIFNLILYLMIAISIYFWIKHDFSPKANKS
jgi:exosortase/archaeosortase family protein